MSKVTVVADKNGNVISISQNNPEYGWFFVQEETTQITMTGWLRPIVKKARIMGKVVDIEKLDYREGDELPGKVIIVESLIPFNIENPDRDLKIAGDTGIICRVNDQPIYRQTFYTTNSNAVDELIQHSNTQEIKEVLAAQKAMSSMMGSNRHLEPVL